MPTPHISAPKGAFAKTVLMPGDPLRAKYIAETFLENAELVTSVRNILGYTGTYKGKKISVMGSGMGQPSIGIYSYELYTEYDVENIIRIGSCGSYQKDVNIRDIIIAQGACSESNFVHQYGLPGMFAPIADWSLLRRAVDIADQQGKKVLVGNILSSDVFYNATPDALHKWAAMGVLAVEMEAAALYMNAAKLGKKALCILTVSDSLITHESTSVEERETTFTEMMEIALEFGE
ncbi:purine nucleoside phosphorylase [Erysipelotrichaceae bacterium]|nr:purine nucleoside phosphorylase [Erysipelotrichaceae bacterium]